MGLGPQICRKCWEDKKVIAHIWRSAAHKMELCERCSEEPDGGYFGLFMIPREDYERYHNQFYEA